MKERREGGREGGNREGGDREKERRRRKRGDRGEREKGRQGGDRGKERRECAGKSAYRVGKWTSHLEIPSKTHIQKTKMFTKNSCSRR